MVKKLLLFYFLGCFINPAIMGQQEAYSVKLAPFSSNKYDEFSPVYYKNGIVFCSNRKSSSLSDYSTSQGQGTLKINYIDTTGKVTWRKAQLFSKSLTTHFNDGPVTFNNGGDTIYYSRNLRIEGKLRELSTIQNKLGIFCAIFDGKKWINIQEIRFNNELYNMTTPYLSSDGLKLFFASDRPGGFGGSDIYFSQFKDGYWEDPVNLGPSINTIGNESYPFINDEGELFFSSDGHDGLGGKDIYVTKRIGSAWYPPIRLDAPLNSKYDDFGIISYPMVMEGYFSSRRGKTIDIYHFKSNRFHFWFSEPQKKNQYCFSIADTGSIEVDTLRFSSIWDFGDGSKVFGKKIGHCFPGPGNYKINLDIIDKKTGKLFFRKASYDIDILNVEQPYITCPDIAIAGDTVYLDGLKSFCPGYNITGYFWDFGDGANWIGDRVSHVFNESGEFDVRMGLTLKSQATGDIIKRVVSKKVRVLQWPQEKASYLAANINAKQEIPDIRQIENIKVNGYFSAENDINKGALFQVVVLSSPSKIALNSQFFKKVPAEYSVKEIFDAGSGSYCYIVDQQMNLMAALPAYNTMISCGYGDAIIRIFVLKEPAEKELLIIRKNYNLLTDSYFDASNRLTTSAYIMLDQVSMLMNRYPGVSLEIGVHTDNLGSPANNQILSQFRAQVLVNYLINRGIDSKRLTARGYGATRPIASNTFATDRRLNRRIDFTIVKE
jgi:outer membrane protein OmpA-like peptidoglycan-associated protein